MEACPHDLTERETACANGLCPICQGAALALLKEEITRLKGSQLGDAYKGKRRRASMQKDRGNESKSGR